MGFEIAVLHPLADSKTSEGIPGAKADCLELDRAQDPQGLHQGGGRERTDVPGVGAPRPAAVEFAAVLPRTCGARESLPLAVSGPRPSRPSHKAPRPWFWRSF